MMKSKKRNREQGKWCMIPGRNSKGQGQERRDKSRDAHRQGQAVRG